jgi:hypothetical protein
MPKSKGVVGLKAFPDRKPRYVPDPHRRGRVIPSKTIYSRKARTSREAGPSGFSGLPTLAVLRDRAPGIVGGVQQGRAVDGQHQPDGTGTDGIAVEQARRPRSGSGDLLRPGLHADQVALVHGQPCMDAPPIVAGGEPFPGQAFEHVERADERLLHRRMLSPEGEPDNRDPASPGRWVVKPGAVSSSPRRTSSSRPRSISPSIVRGQSRACTSAPKWSPHQSSPHPRRARRTACRGGIPGT